MSSRAKRPLKLEGEPSSSTSGKRPKRRCLSGSDDEDGRGKSAGHWTLKAWGDIPAHSIYNTTSRSQPAELFRKDLISAMKLPDSEPLGTDDYWVLSDPWKQEWEKGVQVPVNPDEIPQGIVRTLRKKDKSKDYKLPLKLIRTTHDEFFSNDFHQMSNAPSLAEKQCRYDLDHCDLQWLKLFNAERIYLGLVPVQESVMEQIIEELETQCYENMQEEIQKQAGLGIEYDEDVICDVCRSPDSEEGNEMVFCDSCDICVHQACYGITNIPDGSWLCKTCQMGIKPNCILCPNKGGAMKTTKSCQKWAHVSCALWIPEVSIGCVDRMEPIVKISQIPASRWALVCCICRDRIGACIQCSVKTCKTAYHVTCAFKNGLYMKAIIEDQSEEDGVRLRSYCPKHTKSHEKKDGESSDSESESGDCTAKGETSAEHRRTKRKKIPTKTRKQIPKHEMNSEEKANQRAKKIEEIESNFHQYVTAKEVTENLNGVDEEIVQFLLEYWKLKRTSAFNKSLLAPKSEEGDLLGREREGSVFTRMRMFIHLRQDLERVRNLCYMVNRREKLNLTWFRLREEIFRKQVSAISDPTTPLPERERTKVIHAGHGASIYDRLYSWDVTCCQPVITNPGSAVKMKRPVTHNNGAVLSRTPQEKLPNPYAKTYVNGRSQRRGVNSESNASSGGSGTPVKSGDSGTRSRNASGSTVDVGFDDDVDVTGLDGDVDIDVVDGFTFESSDVGLKKISRRRTVDKKGESRLWSTGFDVGNLEVSKNCEDSKANTQRLRNESGDEDEVFDNLKVGRSVDKLARLRSEEVNGEVSEDLCRNVKKSSAIKRLTFEDGRDDSEGSGSDSSKRKRRLRKTSSRRIDERGKDEQHGVLATSGLSSDEVSPKMPVEKIVQTIGKLLLKATSGSTGDAENGLTNRTNGLTRRECRRSRDIGASMSETSDVEERMRQRTTPTTTTKQQQLAVLSPTQERARQESVKVRQTLFQSAAIKSGYRIPKKSTPTPPCSSDSSTSSSVTIPLSPDGHQSVSSWQSFTDLSTKDPESPSLLSPPCNGTSTPTRHDDAINRSPRLIIKLRKDPNCIDTSTWCRDYNIVTSTGSASPNDEPRSQRRHRRDVGDDLGISNSTYGMRSRVSATAGAKLGDPS